MSGVLRGLRFLVTRPAGQGAALMAGIRALGGAATHSPWLAIDPASDLSALSDIASKLATYRACIFISANAVRLASAQLLPRWPASLTAAAIGPGTAKALAELGVVHIVQPTQRFDSEGLLAEDFFSPASCQGQRFALIRGEGGRDFLAEELRKRGAQVDEAAVYRRELHPQALHDLEKWLAADSVPGCILVSSSDALRRVLAAASPALATALRQQRLLVPHPRIAEYARQHGFAQVALSAGGDAGLLAFLQTYNQGE